MIKFLITLLSLLVTVLFSDLLPEYDRKCDYMDVTPVDISLDSDGYYFNREIPKNIFQVWIGDLSAKPEKTILWEKYSDQFGYNYRLFTEKDIQYLSQYIGLENLLLVKFFIEKKCFHSASDIIRMEILKNFGGIYVDCDFYPPMLKGKYIDFSKIFNLTGLVLVAEDYSRNIGNQLALFCMNGFIASSKNQPVISHVCNSFYKNFQKWTDNYSDYDAMYLTGPFVLNKALAGSFTLLTRKYIWQLSMEESAIPVKHFFRVN